MAAHNESDSHWVVVKLAIAWLSTIAGLKLTEWAAVFAIVYTILQIYVLVRDKILRDRPPEG